MYESKMVIAVDSLVEECLSGKSQELILKEGMLIHLGELEKEFPIELLNAYFLSKNYSYTLSKIRGDGYAFIFSTQTPDGNLTRAVTWRIELVKIVNGN